MIYEFGGVEETDKPWQPDGIKQTALGNDEVKDRTAGNNNEDKNGSTNTGLASRGNSYKNTGEKIREDGNELIAKKTNNSVNELKQTKETEAKKENVGGEQAVQQGQNFNNNDNNNNNDVDNSNNEADEFGMNKHTTDKKRRNKGILNKLFWGKQKSGDEQEEKSSHKNKDKYCEDNQEYNSCDVCSHERLSSSSDDMLILRTTTNKVTTTLTTTIDFHNDHQEEKLIEQSEEMEKCEECSLETECKTQMDYQAKLTSGEDEATASSGITTKSGKSAHEHMSKKERRNKAKAEFALHDPLNEEVEEESTTPYEQDTPAKKTKSKGEHAHHVSCTSDEFDDHMVGSVYKGSDICPYCNYPRSSSVWCSVSLRHHGNDALCRSHHSSPSSGHDSSKWSAKTLFKKSKDNKKNDANCEDNDTPHSNDEKTSHPITSWLHRHGPRHHHHHHSHRHRHDGNDPSDDGATSQENASCQSEIENSNTDDKSAEITDTPAQQTLESNYNNNNDESHPNAKTHNVAAVCPVNSQVFSSDETRTLKVEDNKTIDTVNDIVVNHKEVDNVEHKETESTTRVEESHKKVQYYYFVDDNGETMYYATEVEDENVNGDGDGVTANNNNENNLSNENVNDSGKKINCNEDNEQHRLASNVCEEVKIDETTHVNERQTVYIDNNNNENNNEVAWDINDNASTDTASQASLATNNSTEQSCKDGKRKRGFAKKIAHFFSRSNKATSEKEKENVCHHVDPNAMELNVEGNANATICHNKTSSCQSTGKEQTKTISENNVKNAERCNPYADNNNYNNNNNLQVETTDINEGKYTYDAENNVYVSERPAATTVVVTEVAYDTKVHEKKVPRLTEKEFKQRIKELCKDEKKQREVLEMSYKKESSEIKRCCRVGVEEIKLACHNKRHHIKEHKDKSDDADDKKGKKESH